MDEEVRGHEPGLFQARGLSHFWVTLRWTEFLMRTCYCDPA